jgi:tetratricopeptide (TPR) repeat protein
MCPNCRSRNLPAANFCVQCGNRLAVVGCPPSVSLSAAPYGFAGTTISTPIRKPRPPISPKRLAILSGVAAVIGAGVVALVYFQWTSVISEPERRQEALLFAESEVKFGLLITSVRRGSPAETCGMLANDIVIRYAGSEVRDVTTYVSAVEAHRSDPSVAITVWRGGKDVVLTAPPGRIGFSYDDWNPSRRQIYFRLEKSDRAGAAELAAIAESSGSLTPPQVLILKIILIPNRSGAKEEEERNKLIEELLRIYPKNHLGQLGTNEFLGLSSYAAAARCFEEDLALFDRDDVSMRLNLALSYLGVFELDKAEKNARYVVDRKEPGLSEYGVFVSQEVLGGVALGRGKYREALDRFAPYLDGRNNYVVMRALLAAAKLGDLRFFDEICKRANAVAPDDMKNSQFFVDAIHAYALFEKGKKGEAIALVQKWGTASCIVETAARYWNTVPGGTDVADRLQVLLRAPEPRSAT